MLVLFCVGCRDTHGVSRLTAAGGRAAIRDCGLGTGPRCTFEGKAVRMPPARLCPTGTRQSLHGHQATHCPTGRQGRQGQAQDSRAVQQWPGQDYHLCRAFVAGTASRASRQLQPPAADGAWLPRCYYPTTPAYADLRQIFDSRGSQLGGMSFGAKEVKDGAAYVHLTVNCFLFFPICSYCAHAMREESEDRGRETRRSCLPEAADNVPDTRSTGWFQLLADSDARTRHHEVPEEVRSHPACPCLLALNQILFRVLSVQEVTGPAEPKEVCHLPALRYHIHCCILATLRYHIHCCPLLMCAGRGLGLEQRFW